MAQLGRHLPPQGIFKALTGGLLASLMEDPGLRMVGPTGRRTYGGGELNVQTFLRRPAAGPNSDLQRAPVSVNARRALGRTRGWQE